jgi:hypothetical protein
MPRRARVIKREVPPDPRFGSRTLTRFMNKLMLNGKKSLAERIVYTAMESIERQARRSPIDVFDTALRNATPLLEVKPRRVGGRPTRCPWKSKATANSLWRCVGSSRQPADAAARAWPTSSRPSSWTPRTIPEPPSANATKPTAWRRLTKRFHITAGNQQPF